MTVRFRGLVAALAAAVLALGDTPFPWGGDVNPGAGTKLAEAVEKELAGFIHLTPDALRRDAPALVKRRAAAAIEGWKRFRNPELRELARACLDHPDWHVVHRALLWIEQLGDPQACALAWPRLTHREAAVREIAALTCLAMWDDAAATSFAGGKAREELKVRRVAERDPCVRQSLLALERRLDGKLSSRVILAQAFVKRRDGLIWAPFVRGLGTLEQVAPDLQVEPHEELASRGIPELHVTASFHVPVLAFGKPEEVPRITLQPFGHERQKGTIVHTGQDLCACRDGAGLYAIADGVVCMIASGTDMGIGIVVTHRRTEQDFVNSVYMHGGGTVFVAAGETVTAGQLLARIGLSFSIENGGQFAHLHLGLYPGPFAMDHNYGYRPAGKPLTDWLDPAKVLPQWIAASR